MISIIICSKKGDISDLLKSNIEDTIGIPYELIVINNSTNKYSIFEAYNEGIKKSSFPFLCFMHEDIQYYTKDWGKSVIQHLPNPQTGLIGLAGSSYLIPMPAPWFYARPYICNVSFQKDCPPIYPVAEEKEVVGVDGVWFCSRKDVFNDISFDTDSFHNFHFYDLDISMQIHEKGYHIHIIPNIHIVHESMGRQDSSWIQSSYIFYHKWKKELAFANVSPATKKEFLVETKAFKNILCLHKTNNYPVPKELLKIGWKRLRLNILTAYALYLISRSIHR
ncbi:MAG: glycosyltransferase family protein [Candidatus Symbiothrix sp.]|jgi:hypothetical protein|nr:glycosyltransferase family protein [Candidatus Symbiothrix sp.]